MSDIATFHSSIGPRLRESFEVLVHEMIHEGAGSLISELENNIQEVKDEIDAINSERQTLSVTKANFETIYEGLQDFLKTCEEPSLDLIMLKMVLKGRIKALCDQIDELRPNGLLKQKTLLKERRDFLIDNRQLGFKIARSLQEVNSGH